MKIQRLEVCKRLKLNPSTFDRAVKAGKLPITHDASISVAGHPATLVELSDVARWRGIAEDELLALLSVPEPEPAPQPVQPEPESQPAPAVEPEPAPRPESAPEPELPPIEQRALEDAEFAEAYKRGEATDSAGNTIIGSNDRFPSKGLQSLLGPVEEQPEHKPSGVSHMDPNLVCNPDVPHNPVDSDEFNELWHPGHKDRKAAMYRDARIPQPSEQQVKQHVDRAAILAAFRQGYSR